MYYLIVFAFILTSCTIKVDAPVNATGNFNASGSVNASIHGTVAVSSPTPGPSPSHVLTKPIVSYAYAAGVNWNDYVTTLDATVGCLGSETSYRDCMHAGEMRKATTGETSCDNLTMTDSLGVFDWTCVMENTAVFYSKLKPGKGLSNLITSTAWISNYVSLCLSTDCINSDTNVWWSNTIATLPSNTATSSVVAQLSGAGVIYVTASDILSSGYNIVSDKVSVVTLNGATITYNGRSGTNAGIDGSPTWGYLTVLASGSHKFLWIEGNFSLNTTGGGTMALLFSATTFSRFNNLHTFQGNNGVFIYQGHSNTLTSLELSLAGDSSLQFDTTTNNLAQDILSHDNYYHYAIALGNSGLNNIYNLHGYNNFGGIRVSNSTASNSFSQILSTNTSSGIYVTNNTYPNYFSEVTLANISGNGMKIEVSTGNVFHNLVIYNANNGIMLNNESNDTLSQVVTANNTIGITGYNASGTKLTGNFLVGSNTSNCQVAGTTGYTSSCGDAGASDANIITGITLTNSFLGLVSSLTESFQSWGMSTQGYCTTNCNVLDWSISKTDNVILNKSNTATTSNVDCPSSVLGTLALTSVNGITYLKNAVELNTSAGNRNGLCETGDICLYTPNYGVYQGEGELTHCTFNSNGGSISNVTMFYYPMNGR